MHLHHGADMTDQAKAARTATLTLGDKTVELPVLSGSTGPDVIDIRKLYGATDAFTYDPVSGKWLYAYQMIATPDLFTGTCHSIAIYQGSDPVGQ